MDEHITFTGSLWVWTGSTGGAWHFLSITGEAAEALFATALMRRMEGLSRGFGAIKVRAQVGATRWETSVFPQKADAEGPDRWLLPVKAAVRKAEGLVAGEPATVDLRF